MAINGLLVKIRGGDVHAALAQGFGANAVERVLSVPGGSPSTSAFAEPRAAIWYRIRQAPAANPWDAAHAVLTNTLQQAAFADATGADVEFVEPDLEQSWLAGPATQGNTAAMATACTFHPQDPGGGKATSPEGNAWNLGSAYSQLDAARSSGTAPAMARVQIAHLDTGYDPDHLTRPLNLDTSRQRNFRDSDRPNDATDRTPPGLAAFRNRGHGTATLCLLAGKKLEGTTPSWPGFADFLGGAPFATVVPVRIADWVVRFSTGTMVQGFQHAVDIGAHVLTMSMGGLTSRALVDAVNLAYDSGIFVVTAAGNNLAWRPSPKSIVFPARYRRVVAACGVMADGRAYTGLGSGTMQGNYGPASKMPTALAAYTPNVPWAEFGCSNIVSMDGAGTSAATPQIAASAALWIAAHWDELQAYSEPWMRVEAVRYALFESALRSTRAMGEAETAAKLGRGITRAAEALAKGAMPAASLTQTPAAEFGWGWLGALFGGGVSLAPNAPKPVEAMLRLELTQMAQSIDAVDTAIADCDIPTDQIPPIARNRYLEAALDHGKPSRMLRGFLERHLGRKQVALGALAAKAPLPIKRKPKMLPNPARRLRVFALDPSIAKSMDSVAVNETVLRIPWEEGLEPGPVGEYVEVVDVDPAFNRIYDPVDLNQPKLLAQDGWPPSEGNPEFHQQMVYAVAMRTIGNFEEALGRKVLWAPRGALQRKKDGSTELGAYEVPRLRIYPHALRAENAYYSPDKASLLFGYFQASSRPSDPTPDSTLVFSCLSSDVVAHEMSHALLDGLHRKFQEASNPDVPAFHEGFADIVALLQHFAIPELVRYQIARARGRLDAAKLLGSLAQQFGEGTSRGGPLRDYLGEQIDKFDYATTTEVHARGSILVSAVYRAFLKIVDSRTEDLIRIATGGSGVLPEGALHPDLVSRLTDEACKTARHVLRMCIRALDYCPAVDITFGEFLRALITADIDLVADDKYHYRLAFMEAFRRRGLLPRDVRTVSEESLAWGTLEDPRPDWLPQLVADVDFGWDRVLDRSSVFTLNEKNHWRFQSALRDLLTKRPELLPQFGLMDGVPRYTVDGQVGDQRRKKTNGTTFNVPSIRPARRVAPDGSFHVEVVATVLQRRRVPVDPANPEGPQMWFRGGVTLILDPRQENCEVRYAIVKNCASESRLEPARHISPSRDVSAARPVLRRRQGRAVRTAAQFQRVPSWLRRLLPLRPSPCGTTARA